MVSTPLHPASQTQPRARVLQRQRSLLQQRADISRQLVAHATNPNVATLQERQRRINLTATQDLEAGIANPPPSYTPSQPSWKTPGALWATFKVLYAKKAEQAGVPTTELKELSDYNYRFRIETRVVQAPAPYRAAQHIDVALIILPKQGPVLPNTTAFVIQRKAVDVACAVWVGGRIHNVWRPKHDSPVMMKRGALDTFFKPAVPKKPKYEASVNKSVHESYPFSIPHLPVPFSEQLGFVPAEEGKPMNDQLDLYMVYYQPYIPAAIAPGVFEFLRQELPFYRVQYNITRGNMHTQINTPRFTTVFGVDATSRFAEDGTIVDAKTGQNVESSRYKCKPRPIPHCLDELRTVTEGTTGETFNFCLVNYYADGKDSISYHSDDERFLGPNPAIASFSLGAKRDFLMKHKPIAPVADSVVDDPKSIKLALGPGDMVLMRGRTQSNWLHSIPKRAGVDANKGRINITFRKAMVKDGTENYYQYNVGNGSVYKWDAGEGKMKPWVEEAEVGDARGNV